MQLTDITTRRIDEQEKINPAVATSKVLARFKFRGLAGILALCLPLGVQAAPSINAQPANVVATVGDVAPFVVGANGVQPLSYQWLKNGISIPGETNNNFNISAVADGDAAGYSVIVTNTTGSVTSRVALLTVV